MCILQTPEALPAILALFQHLTVTDSIFLTLAAYNILIERKYGNHWLNEGHQNDGPGCKLG